MRAALIIPVHNRRDITLGCLRSLHRSQLPLDFGIIVVDDGSTDGTAAAIGAAFPSVTVEHGNGDLFWTGGIVQGMRRALAETATFLFWLNDDCLPEEEALPRMLAFLEKNPRTICGASCFVAGSDRAAQTAFRDRNPVDPVGSVTEVDGLSGYCVGMPASVCQEIGFPDALRLPHYGADSIYTLAAKRRGYRVVLLKEARVTLLDEKTVQTLEGRMQSSRLRLPEFIRQTFLARKSPFFLKSQYWYHSYKYGFFVGGFLFLMKFFRWVWTIAVTWHRRSLPLSRQTLGSN